MEQSIVTLSEAAAITRTSPATLRWWRQTGAGPKSFKIGRRVMYKLEDLDRFLREAYELEGAR